MASIELSQLASIPFIDVSALEGRFLSSLTFHDGKSWRLWASTSEHTLIELKIAWPAEGFYFARQPESATDMHFRFLNFIAQHAAFPELKRAVTGIMDDIANLSASLSKLKLLHASRETVGQGTGRMAATEVEYILLVCRSFFDLLQEVVTRLWSMVHLVDPVHRKSGMPRSFADVAIVGGQPVTAARLMEKYGLSPELADFYASSAPFFMDLRTIRDNLIHNGSQVSGIMSGESDFLVHEKRRPFSTFGIWRDDERQPNDLVPLTPAIAVVVYRTLVACETFSIAMQRTVALPPEIVPGMGFFMRGYFNEYFLTVMEEARIRTSWADGEVGHPAPG
ncbi:hypothetical protein ACFQ3P_25630 [Paraburkholderia sabiae]|uniref:DUF4238 domain-containing protein n=1 Tax=Paraburkholderia sabiae TaxID=273251 RepID=A0ABU9QN08_9BURK|nr:hypothetical protein [Paraburkholderia sabiae]WJZ77296.1 hypothetical protein QEN71_35065 [Paraburkholderia sabiae]CAD6548079.1 hypothetical protein LMG24235_04526 [Paraburkholderia sabiae]